MHQHPNHIDVVVNCRRHLGILGSSCRLAGVLLITSDIGNILDQGEAPLIAPNRVINDRVKGNVMCRMLHGEGATHRTPGTGCTRAKQHNERRN